MNRYLIYAAVHAEIEYKGISISRRIRVARGVKAKTLREAKKKVLSVYKGKLYFFDNARRIPSHDSYKKTT